MTIDPKLSEILNIIAAIFMVTVASSADLTAIFGDKTANLIIHACAYLGAIIAAVNVVLHRYSSPQAGPGVDQK